MLVDNSSQSGDGSQAAAPSQVAVRCGPLAPRRYWNAWIILWLLQLVPLVFVLLDVPLRLCRGARMDRAVLLGSLPVLGYAVLVGWLGGTRRGRRWLCGHRLQLLLSATSMLVAYLVCESVATLVALRGRRAKSLIVYEDAGKTVRFDPVRGYRLGPLPSRYARITDGTLEYMGQLRGNNAGFPDRDDISPTRASSAQRRFAVFGDSFTAAQFLRTNWPDRVEDLTRQTTEPLQLLNLSVDGGGLANWWSVLTRILEAQKYQLDGVVFAVYPGDLRRGFSIAEYQGYTRPRFARVPSWNPRHFPATAEEAQTYYEAWDATILGSTEFEAALQGQWGQRPPVPYLANRLSQAVLRPAWRQTMMSLRGIVDLESERRAMIADIRRALAAMRLPALVVQVPNKERLMEPGTPGPIDADTREFAEWIGARCVNGGLAFAGRTAAQIRADWLPHDGHWAQGGSDRFADFAMRILSEWPSTSPAPRRDCSPSN